MDNHRNAAGAINKTNYNVKRSIEYYNKELIATKYLKPITMSNTA